MPHVLRWFAKRADLSVALAAALAAAVPGGADAQGRWRFGVTGAPPTRILEVNETAFPDSNNGRVRLGVALGAEASRAWPLQPQVTAFGFLRVTTADVQTSLARRSWSAGRAFVLDAGGRIERSVSPGASVFGGGGVSHWSGPGDTAPFSGLSPIVITTEAGVSLHPGNQRLRIDFTANLTRFGADESRGIATGFVWRFFAGIRRAY